MTDSTSTSQKHAVFGLFGAGGFSREVMPFAAPYFTRLMESQGAAGARVCFVDTHPHASRINGVTVMSEEEFFALDCAQRYFNIAAADSALREKIAIACLARGATPLTLQAPNATVYIGNRIAEGAVLCANTIITSNTTIGRFFHSNIYSYVAHDCEIGDFVTFAPGVHCNGNVRIEDHAYIGTGAVLKQGAPGKPLVIGAGAVVGMGAVVTKDVASHATVVGNPARPHESRA